MNILNRVGKINVWILGCLVMTIALPTFVIHLRRSISAISPAGSVIEVSGNVSELKYLRDQKTNTLKLHDDLYFQDVVKTGPTSSTRLLLTPEKDKKTVSLFLYENSELFIQPTLVKADGKRERVVKFTKGLLRGFVKGLTQGEEVKIQVPGGTVGIRGTIFEIGCVGLFSSNLTTASTANAKCNVIVQQGSAAFYPKDKIEEAISIPMGTGVVVNESTGQTTPIVAAPLNETLSKEVAPAAPQAQPNDQKETSQPTGNTQGNAGEISENQSGATLEASESQTETNQETAAPSTSVVQGSG
ncbi:MAG: FecR domain-containing protein [Deltaproteobacteria bacterium]|nr:FecR domain-containing protein [Deltaproteobacteria bacterium]